MEIMREPLKAGRGRRRIVAKFSNITTQTAHNFLLQFAMDEFRDRRGNNPLPLLDIKVSKDTLSGRSTVILRDYKDDAVRYFQRWPKP